MFRKIRLVLVKSSHSKEGLDEKTPDQPSLQKPKNKSKFLGLFHSSSDPDLHSKSKTRKSFLRRKKNHEKESKENQDDAASEILNNRIERLPENLLPENLLPENLLPDDPFPDKSFLAHSGPDNVFAENKLTDNSFSENASQKHSILNENPPFDTLKSMSVSTINSTSQKHALINSLPNDEAWKRAQEVWEKNETEETKEKEKEKRRKKGKREHDRKREGKEERDGKTRTRSKSREKDKEHAGKERSESKSRSMEKKKRTKDEYEESKKEERRGKDEKHKKYKSKSERHSGHKRESSENLKRFGYESDSDLDYRHENKTDRKPKHDQRRRNDLENAHHRTRDHSLEHTLESTHDRYHDSPHDHTLERTHYHSNDRTHDRARTKEHKHHDHQKYKSEKHSKNQEEHHKHKELKSNTNRSPYSDDKKIELDKVWREYKSGKRYHSQEKDMKKVIDRLDGVERFRREERLRSSDRSHDRSSDTSCEVARRSRSRERRRRSRSREKQKHESDQDSNHSSAWQYSLSRIEARQEQCTADIDTARRSIEHRIKQLEIRFEKQYSSSERLPEKSPEKSNTGKPRNFKKIIDQVADECREVTRTLEVRTEEMNSEIASVVREELSHLDEKLSNNQRSRPSSPGTFSDMRVVENFRCEETTTNPMKDSRYDNKTKLDVGVTSVEPISSADESMVTVIEENSRTRNLSKEGTATDSLSPSSSRDSPVRVSQSGALDTLNEQIGQKNSVSSTCDSGISADNQLSPIDLTSPGIENLHELSLASFEDDNQYDGSNEQVEGSDCTGTEESLQMEYRRKIKETEARFQERAIVEKEILYRRINELESMLLAKRENKGQYA